MSKTVWIVHRDDAADDELDVFDDWGEAKAYAAATAGWVEEQPILRLSDEYVQQRIRDWGT